LLDLSDEAFAARFRGRAIMRARRDGMARNACIALGNVGEAADLPHLYRALRDRSPLVRGHAAWAIGRIVERHRYDKLVSAAALQAALADEADGFAREEMLAALESLSREAGRDDGS
jgi:epoxyqueuosine reductase